MAIPISHPPQPDPCMKIRDLPLPPDIIDYYEKTGIIELYPPQADAIEKGLLGRKNILAAIPTASGKTLLAELAMLSAIGSGGKALYIVPLRALASEKYERFKEFGDLGIRVGISSGDLDSRDEYLGDNDIIVATSEKADSLLRNETQWMYDLTAVVIDEVHLLDSPDRGPTLEVTIARMRRINPYIHIIALSATVGNAQAIADWLDAECVSSEWRPVDLQEGVLLGSAIHFPGREIELPAVRSSRSDPVEALVLDTLESGGQCLIFDSSRRNAASTAARVSKVLASCTPPASASSPPTSHTSHNTSHTSHTSYKTPHLAELADTVRETDTDAARKLAGCIECAAAFHHAGLLPEHRRIVENGFRNNKIKVIACTPTLAFGLNLPARRVIIKSYRRYNPNYGMEPIPILEYKQMAGRAGRPHLDPSGECVLIAKSYSELQRLIEGYIESDPEPIYSKLGTESALRSHILSAITGRFGASHDELMDFLQLTFFAAQQETSHLRGVVETVLDFLSKNEMITMEDELIAPTTLGKLVSRLYLDPHGAAIIVDGLRLREEVGVSDLTLLHLICRTPDLRKLYLRKKDYEWIPGFACDMHDEFTEVPSEFDSGHEWFLGEVKTAAMLLDWVGETPDKNIETRFGIGGGDIRGIADTAQWIAYATAQISVHIKSKHAKRARELTERLKYGIKSELLPLVTIRGIGRARARTLHEAGYTTPGSLVKAGKTKIGRVIGQKVAESAIKNVESRDQAELFE
ncbi:MAG: ATP-dependent DNA helicase [Methanosarcinales archaeon]|nr:MAG: ATP-dependent DNA helicase [Methanosarcinales archaeon]